MTDDKEDWIWTEHIQSQMKERKISRDLVEAVLNAPDEKVPGKKTRLVYQKRKDEKLIRVVTEDRRLITVYVTDKIKKYVKE